MRRWRTIAGATVREVLSEPLTLLVLLSALALSVLAPVFHYHQFGEAARMARDAGLSALFTAGGVIAVFGTIRTCRREIETGTREMALAHSVSPGLFFLAKAAGAFGACLVFVFIVFSVAALVVEGAELGGEIARRSGDIARIPAPFLAGALVVTLLPLVLGALLNRFRRCRFVQSVLLLAFLLAGLALTVALIRDARAVARFSSAAALLLLPMAMLVAAAAAASVRFSANVAATAMLAVFVGALPAVGNYYLAEVLSRGGSVSLAYLGMATAAMLPAVAAFLLLGVTLSSRK